MATGPGPGMLPAEAELFGWAVGAAVMPGRFDQQPAGVAPGNVGSTGQVQPSRRRQSYRPSAAVVGSSAAPQRWPASTTRKPARPTRSSRANGGRAGSCFIRCMVLKVVDSA